MIRNILSAPVERVSGAALERAQDLLAVEEPLEIQLGRKTVAVTMRTPGNDFELAAGFLLTEGIIEDRAQIARIRHNDNGASGRRAGNSVRVHLQPGFAPDLDRLKRNFYMSSSCGVCGKASIDAIQAAHCPSLPRDVPVVDRAMLCDLPRRLRASQAVFEHTGGLHACALFDACGELIAAREDVGRHNALDKLIGFQLLEGHVPLRDRLILVSGRASFELVQKALMGGVALLAAVGAPSSLAVEAAQRFGMTLAGFVRDGRFNIYSGEWRIR